MKKAGKILMLLACLAVLILCFPQIGKFITTYLWYQEVGYEAVFLKYTFAKFVIGIVVFLLVFILSFATLYATTGYQPEVTVEEDGTVNVPTKKKGRKYLAAIPSLVLGVLAGGLSATVLWQNILLALNQTTAGVTDPVFHQDISFYFFDLSLLETIFWLAVLFLAVIFVFNLIMTFYLQGLHKKTFKTMAKRIVGFMAAFMLLLIVGFLIQAANLLYVREGSVYGAGYTDMHVTLPMYYGAAAACLLSAITLLVGMKKKSLKVALVGPIILAIFLAAGTVLGSTVQSLIVAPSEISKEQPYISNNIEMTNKAYNLEDITEVEFSGAGNLTSADLHTEMNTLQNVRLIDYRPTITVFNQLQTMRLYYKFVDVDIDRYQINHAQQQVYLSAREMDQDSLDSSAQTWINKYLKYTHGYGAVVTPVNQITSQGQPEILVGNIPPQTSVPELTINRPEIYYGQLTNDYVIVNTKEPEFDYPSGDSNVQCFYEGDAGIPLTLANRALFALEHHNYRILVSNLINGNSKILINRNILDRVTRIAPFLTFDGDPYLVIDDKGQLIWVIEGFTSSDKYPYATKITNTASVFFGKNYVRNSVKVTVNAYNGETNFYIVDETDPLVTSYAKIFPTLFKSMDEMPQSIREHLKYSTAMFELQTEIYQQYHMKDATVFYNKEDVWAIANEMYGSNTTVMEPYFVNMQLPGSNKLEFLLMRPFTPTQKQNMVSWLAARCDGDNYGKLVLFKFPKQSTIYGPEQIESRISNDSEISQNLNLWDQQGSSVIRSNLLVIPIKDSILYVEPIYLTTNGENSLPEVVRIVLAYKDRIVMGRTLDDALSEMFGTDFKTDGIVEEIETEVDPDSGESTTVTETIMGYDELVAQIKAAYANARYASQNGNWADYGAYMDELEAAINKLGGASISSDTPEDQNSTEVTEDSAESTEPSDDNQSDDATELEIVGDPKAEKTV